MLVYSRREYRLEFAAGSSVADVEWPAQLQLDMELAPGFLFGVEDVPAGPMVAASGRSLNIGFNAHEGVLRGSGGHRLPLVSLDLPFRSGCIQVAGKTCHFQGVLSDSEELVPTFRQLWASLCDAASALAPTPIRIVKAVGSLGTHSFRVLPEIERGKLQFMGADRVANGLAQALRWRLVGDGVNPRIRAAFSYVAQIGRLRAVQLDQREFAGEIVLNAAKAVEVLFGSVDALREAGPDIGLTDHEVELLAAGVYLRSTIDVAHPTATLLSQSERQTLLTLIDQLETLAPHFVSLVADAVNTGAVALPVPSPADARRREARKEAFLSRVAEALAHLGTRPEAQ